MNICNTVGELLAYALEKELIEKYDVVDARNRLLDALKIGDWTPDGEKREKRPLCSILGDLCDYAFENGIIDDNGVVTRDLFDTKLMGILTPRPSEVIRAFNARYALSPETATEYYYKFAKDTNYIRTDRIARDVKWVYDSNYGPIDITINLSKPEKDPKAIAAAKLQKQSGYPKCALCRENEGFAGTLSQQPRCNHRLIPMTVAGQEWFLQYSPYVYYNEHCIALSGEHTPMKIDRSTFVKQTDFVTVFPHYFLGSNADLPIVGGSILTHDHMQGGHYTFAMEKAPVEKEVFFKGYPQIKAGIVRWPMSVLRLTTSDKEALIDLCDKILCKWRGYTDKDAFVFAETDGEPHNTVTPIARRRGSLYEIDLVLRNNITTEEHPLGVYHPHEEKHNIKKENIGLIEVMGLAVLPARLKKEMALLADAVLADRDFKDDETLGKHYEWFCAFKDNYTFTKDNIHTILQQEIGRTFEAVLEDAGVYKCDEKGRRGFMKFVDSVNE